MTTEQMRVRVRRLELDEDFEVRRKNYAAARQIAEERIDLQHRIKAAEGSITRKKATDSHHDVRANTNIIIAGQRKRFSFEDELEQRRLYTANGKRKELVAHAGA